MNKVVSKQLCIETTGNPYHRPQRQISLPFYILQPVKSLPFHITEAWQRYPFRAEPPVQAIIRSTPGALYAVRWNQLIKRKKKPVCKLTASLAESKVIRDYRTPQHTELFPPLWVLIGDLLWACVWEKENTKQRNYYLMITPGSLGQGHINE